MPRHCHDLPLPLLKMPIFKLGEYMSDWIYSVLGTHDRVSEFRYRMHAALRAHNEYNDPVHPALVSIADQFINKNKISRKQLSFAMNLLDECPYILQKRK